MSMAMMMQLTMICCVDDDDDVAYDGVLMRLVMMLQSRCHDVGR